MESKPSRYHHRKLSSFSNGFSSKTAYDDVFSGLASFGARKVSSRVVEDYKAIFGSSRASSIPILDLSSSPSSGDGFSDYRSSELDYSNIFGGLREEDAGVSYEQVVASGGTKREKGSSPKVRIPSAAGSPLHSSETLKTSSENKVFPSDASFQSFDDKKHFNMSYNVSNTGSKDGRNGTTYVTQFHPVPGFTCFIDETSPQKIEVDNPKSSVISEIRHKLDLSEASLKEEKTTKAMSHLSNKETFGREVKSRNGFSWDGSSANDKLFNEHENNHKSHSSELRPPSSVPAKMDRDENSMRSGASSFKVFNKHASEHAAGDCSPTLFGEELDVNSAAAASAAVLKDAIQKAQESIRIAKVLMEKKKEGLRSRSGNGARNSSKVRDRKETIIAHEENRTDDTNTKETSGDVDYVSQLFSGMRKKSGLRSGPGAPIKPISPGNNRTVVPFIETMDKDEPNVMEVHIFLKTLEPQEVIVHKESADEKSHDLAYRVGKLNNVRVEKETENRVDQVESANLFSEHEGVVNCSSSQGDELTEETHTDTYVNKDSEKKLKDSLQNNEDALKFGVYWFKENHNGKRLDYVQEQEEIKNEQEVSQQDTIIKTKRDLKEEGSNYTTEKFCSKVVDDEKFEDAYQWVEDKNEPKEVMDSECNNKEKDNYMRPDSKRRDKVHEQEIYEKTLNDIPDEKESEQLSEDFDFKGNEQDLTKISAETQHMHLEAGKTEVLQEAIYEINYEDVLSCDVSNKSGTEKAFPKEINHINSETCQGVDDSDGKIGASKDFYSFKKGETETVRLAHRMREKEHGKIVNFVQNHAEDTLTGNGIKVLFEVLPSDSPPKFSSTCIKFDRAEFAQRNKDLYSVSDLDVGPEILASESTEKEDAREDNNSNNREGEKSSAENFDEKEHVSTDFEICEGFNGSKAKQKTIEVDEEIKTRQNTEKDEESSQKTIVMEEKEMKIDEVIQTSQSKDVNDENPNKVHVMDEKETKSTVSEAVREEETLSKIYEKNKREQELEKIAVERAIREARERAFAEAREKAERAAVEKATAEVRHRVMAEAREKFDKDSAATKVSTEKASFKAKLRSERAAVERATAEARERALEKALSQKAREQAERFTSQNLAGPSGDNSMKKSFSSSDLEKNLETNTELVQRNKATLEKHERIMERAAKALAEKNMRDLLVQREQAEKNRLAEALDADIKRWSSGKEGNLRALLSTLQHILGPGSGWQPISLTEIITTSAVKKAYRKATLYVHPDKLQQRGASIQQKYICEKVFDLLKAAWTRFNKEER